MAALRAMSSKPSTTEELTGKPIKSLSGIAEDSGVLVTETESPSDTSLESKEGKVAAGKAGGRITSPGRRTRKRQHTQNVRTASAKRKSTAPGLSLRGAARLPLRCSECLHFMDDPDMKLFPGAPHTAMEEHIALTNPKLSVFSGEKDVDNIMEDKPQHKITNFSIYDKYNHLCAFDTGLIERDKDLFLSGVLKPIFEENPCLEGGVACGNMGPLSEWFISGFDEGENALIGLATAYAEYILMEPSEVYKPFIQQMKVKVHLTKIVIEFLTNNLEASYEDLLNRVQLCNVDGFSEDSLLWHAQFVVDQIQGYDDAADEDEPQLLATPCIRSLVEFTGVTLTKRSHLRRNMGKVKKEKKSLTRATVTPLVRGLFDTLFQGQILEGDVKIERRQRCGICKVCQQPDCGICLACIDMTKFGGPGIAKQACKQRRCPNLTMKSDGDDEDECEDSLEQDGGLPAFTEKKHKVAKLRTTRVVWVGQPVDILGRKCFYGEVVVGDLKLCRGDYVSISPADRRQAYYIARIQYLYETARGDHRAHVQWFYRGSETVLGEVSDPLELFFVQECGDTALVAVHSKVKVIFKETREDWSMCGDVEEAGSLLPADEDDGNTFFFQKAYNPELCRFEEPSAEALNGFREEKSSNLCVICEMVARRDRENVVSLGPLLDSSEKLDKDVVHYESVRKEGTDYRVGDCCYVDPDVFEFKIKHPKIVKSQAKTVKVDEDIYPEAYRKTKYVKGSNACCPEPFRVVRITEIFVRTSTLAQADMAIRDIKLKLNKFYRTEDTHEGSQAGHSADLHKLYWSEEHVTLSLCYIKGKCSVVYRGNLTQSLDAYFLSGTDRFYFSQAYNADSRQFEDAPFNACTMGVEAKEERKILPLRTMDVFSGCGGLSEGLHQAGISEPCWAIEIEEAAAKAFSLNQPDCTVFTDDCNLLLRAVMEGEQTDKLGQRLPQKGDVELLCGGPPCQGFSGMNRFNSRDYSRFKNSLIASYLSYCNYYRPRFFLLENVRNFVSFKGSMVLKLTLRCLLRMGYQCTFGLLQAGNYGVAQTRRRAIILAAAPGEKLPKYPEPLHTFAPRAMQLSVVVDQKKFNSNIKNRRSAPYRTVTVRDAMSDLADVNNEANAVEIPYKDAALTHFQRLVRGEEGSVLRDHICKEMSPLVTARMTHIPLSPGSDWRDLPNLQLTLSDGTKTKKLVYSHHDKRNGRGPKGQRRGVCSCATGRPCDPMDRQYNTLVPWCLPHTANRYNHWAGLYGRLDWDGFFSTTITNPEPMGKQGRVLHPEQHRVVSVRECARSQGFPDTYRFFGNIWDKHRQVGNAVPPPMGRALGLEIKKCLIWKQQEEKSNFSTH